MAETSQPTPQTYRQGDILLMRCGEIPLGACVVAPDGQRVILAYGERTGHVHAMAADRVCYYREDGSGGGAFVKVTGQDAVDLTHDEHDTLAIPPGTYRIVQQREYQPRGTPRSAVD